jgi:hypothetical protein
MHCLCLEYLYPYDHTMSTDKAYCASGSDKRYATVYEHNGFSLFSCPLCALSGKYPIIHTTGEKNQQNSPYPWN